MEISSYATILLWNLLTSTPFSLSSSSTKMPTPFLLLMPPKCYNLNPSHLVPLILLIWSLGISSMNPLFFVNLTSSMDFSNKVIILQDPTLILEALYPTDHPRPSLPSSIENITLIYQSIPKPLKQKKIIEVYPEQ